jgi:hypothetical protein
MNCRLLKETENLVMSDMSYCSILNQGSILYKYQLSKQLFSDNNILSEVWGEVDDLCKQVQQINGTAN